MRASVWLVWGIILFSGRANLLFSAPPQYQVIDLGTLGGSLSAGYAINEAGQITGYSNMAGDDAHHAFLYDGIMRDLGTLGGTSSEGYGINAAGQVVGESDTPGDNAVHAFVFFGISKIDLGTFEGTNSVYDSIANGINDSGFIVGGARTGTVSHAFLDLANKMSDLGTLGGKLSSARAINASGQITGESDISTNSSRYHAFLYSNGIMTNLGTLGGNSEGTAINNSGQIAGNVEVNVVGLTADWHAFFYANGTMKDLGTLGGDQSFATSINDSGQITGYSFLPLNQGPRRAFLYADGVMYDLNTLATNNMGSFDVLNYAGGINNKGWITGYGVVHPSGQIHAFLAKPLGLSLNLRFEDGQIIISWDNTERELILESSPALGPSANWLRVATPSENIGSRFEIKRDIIAGSNLFYRLRSP